MSSDNTSKLGKFAGAYAGTGSPSSGNDWLDNLQSAPVSQIRRYTDSLNSQANELQAAREKEEEFRQQVWDRLYQHIEHKRKNGAESVISNGTSGGFKVSERYLARRVDPFGVTGLFDVTDANVVNAVVNQIPTDRDLDYVASMMVAEENSTMAKRGILGTAFDIGTEMPAFVASFAMSGGIGRAGATAFAEGLSRAAAKKAATSAAPKLMQKIDEVGLKAGAAVARSKLGQVALRGAIQTPITPKALVPAVSKRIGYQVQADDQGNLYVQDPEDAATMIPKALGDAFIEMASENLGFALSETKAMQWLKNGIASMAAKVLRIPAGQSAKVISAKLAEIGYDGVLEEMIEERAGELARGALGIEEGYGVASDIVEGHYEDAYKQLAAELIAFSVPKAGSMAAGAAADRVINGLQVRAGQPPEPEGIEDGEYLSAWAEANPEQAGKLADLASKDQVSRGDIANAGLGGLQLSAEQRKRFVNGIAGVRSQQPADQQAAPEQGAGDAAPATKGESVPEPATEPESVPEPATSSPGVAPKFTSARGQGAIPEVADEVEQLEKIEEFRRPIRDRFTRIFEDVGDDGETLTEEQKGQRDQILRSVYTAAVESPSLSAEELVQDVVDRVKIPEGVDSDDFYDAVESVAETLANVRRGEQRPTIQQIAKQYDYNLIEVKPTTDSELAAEALIKQFGKTPVFVRGDEGFNGATNRKSGEVILRVGRDENPFWRTVGHEIAHATGIDELRDLDDELVQQHTAKRIAKAGKKYADKIRNSENLARREGVASLLGEFFEDSGFRNRLLEEKPPVYKSIANKVVGLLKSFKFPAKAKAEQRLFKELRDNLDRLNHKPQKKSIDEIGDLDALIKSGIEEKVGNKPAKNPAQKKKKKDFKKATETGNSKSKYTEFSEFPGFVYEIQDREGETPQYRTVVFSRYGKKLSFRFAETGETSEESFGKARAATAREFEKNPPRPPKESKKTGKSNREKADDAKAELDAIANEFANEVKNTLLSNVPFNPKLADLARKLTVSALKAGYFEFRAFVDYLADKFGKDLVLKASEYIEAAWETAYENIDGVSPTGSIKEIIDGEGNTGANSDRDDSVSGTESESGGGRTTSDGGTGRNDGEGMAPDTSGGQEAGSDNRWETSDQDRKPGDNHSPGNHRIDAGEIGKGGARTKYKNNIAAIKTIHKIESDGRKHATPEEQAILAKYVGWGMFKGAFNKKLEKPQDGLSEEEKELANPEKWKKEYDEILSLLSPKEWEAARNSTINAHYTSESVVSGMWDIVRASGFNGGRVLEPSAGSGNFLGLQPEDMAQKTSWNVVEMDDISAKILRLLYPDTKVFHAPFQDVAFSDNFFDLVIANYPFADKIKVLSDSRFSRLRPNLHDYFLLKSIEVVRPGGLVVTVTSTGTMDKPGSAIRERVAEKADLVKAIRLPSGAFSKNAGTEVVTDILVFRKRLQDESLKPANWINVTSVKDPGGGKPIPINEYYANNLGQVLGQIDRLGSMWRENSPNVTRTDLFEEQWQRQLESNDWNEIFVPSSSPLLEVKEQRIERSGERTGQLIVKEGKLYQVDGESLRPITMKRTTKTEKKNYNETLEVVQDFEKVRAAYLTSIESQTSERPEEEREEARKNLAIAYDKYIAKHGPISANKTKRLIYNSKFRDSDYWLLTGLEIYNPTPKLSSMKLDELRSVAQERGLKTSGLKKADLLLAIRNTDIEKADAFYRDTVRGASLSQPKTVGDAVVVVLSQHGRIDVEKIASLISKTPSQVEKELAESDIAFENPAKGWEIAATYLSGNVREKLKQARIRAEVEDKFKKNVEALERVLPEDIPFDQIVVRMGAPWISPKDIQDFASELIGEDKKAFHVSYSEADASWRFQVVGKSARRLRESDSFTEVYGHRFFPFDKAMQFALNGKVAKIYTEGPDGNRVVHQEATEKANEKIEELTEFFEDWIWLSSDRQKRLVATYNELNNVNVPPNHDGSHLEFPGMAAPGTRMSKGKVFKGLRGHQKNAVWRALIEGSALLAHEVGTGKTMTKIAIAMELKRLGLASKPAIAVPNARIHAMAKDVQELYPSARILAASKGMAAATRDRTIAEIASGNWDIVLLTHENLEKMPISPQMEESYLNESLQELEEMLQEEGVDTTVSGDQMERDTARSPDLKVLVKMLLAERERLKALSKKRDKTGATFEQTGIDFLIVDEAHEFKNLKIKSRKGSIKGIPTRGAEKATNMEMITRYIQERNNGRGVVFATGTPVTNSLAEIYNMQRFLQRPELEKAGLLKFDAWAATFGKIVTTVEQTHLEVKETTRFRAFINLPELQSMIRNVFDIVRADDVGEIIRPEKELKIAEITATKAQIEYQKHLHQRARNLVGQAEKGGDNHLSIAGDGTRSALDMRLVEMKANESDGTKVNHVVGNVLTLLRENPGTTQVIFSEQMRSKITGFDLFNDLKSKLIEGGIPADKIADFRGAKDTQKAKLAEKIDKGEAWIGLGSTNTLGTGVNIQTHLIAVHHMEPPWTPHAIEQRDGRAWRQNNENETIYSFVYLTIPSLDAWKYLIVTHKDRAIKQFFDFKKTAREIEEDDIDDIPSDFATFSAIASGNPLLIESIKLENDVAKLTRAADRLVRLKENAKKRLRDIERKIPDAEQRIENLKADSEHWEKHKSDEFEFLHEDGTVSKTKDEAGEKFVELASQLRREASRIQGHRPAVGTAGEYRGFKIEIGVVKDGHTSLDIYRKGGPYWANGSILWGESPGNVFISINRNLDNLKSSNLEDAETALEILKKDTESLNGLLNRPFRKQELLDKSLKRQKEVQRLLAEETKGDIEEDLDGDIGPRGSGLPVLPIQINADEIVKGVKKFVARNFRPRNMLSEEMFEANITRQGRINKHTAELDFNIRDLKRAYRKNADPKRPDRLARQIDAVLKGEANPSILPEEVRGPVQRFRDHMDYLSLQIVESGLLTEASEFVFESNYGRYLHRSYEVHDNPRYKASEERKQVARDYIRDDLGDDVTDEQIEHIVNRLSTYTDHPFSPGSGIDGHAEGLVNRSILKYRREIPKPIRDLMGEYRDPIINYAKSITKAAHLLANYQFVNELWEMGEGTVFFDKNDENIDPLATTQFASMGDMRVNPLNGKYARPEIVQAFKDILNHQDMPKWLGRFIQASQAAKYSKTVLSHITHIRNFGSMTFVAVANGHFNPGQFWEAMLTQAEQLGLGNDQTRRALYKRLAELGVVNDSYTAGVMREVLKDFNQSHDLNTGVMTPQTMVDSILKGVRNFNRKAQGLYRAEDEIWRIFGFLHEKERYRAAYPQATEEQLDQIAAKIVRDTFPTYSMLPRGMRALRRFPAIGPFVSFPWEMGRVSISTMRLAMTEINSGNPVLVKTGYARLVGMAFAVIAIPTAVSVATAWLSGVGSDDDDDVRYFLADWNKYSILMWAGRDLTFDMSYMHPYAFMQKPIMAALAGDWKGVLSEAASPYVSEDLFASKLMDLARNQTAQGREVYNQGDSDFEAMKKQIAHLADGMMPGSANSFMRWLHAARGTADENERTYDFMAETIANIFGMRAIKIDIKKSLEWHARRHQTSLSSLTADAKNVFESEGIKSPAELAAAVQRMNARRKALFEEISESVSAAIRQGLTEEEIVDVLADGGIPKSAAMQIVAGEFQPFKMSQISQMDRMTPERAKSFAELTDSETVISAAVARAVHSLGSSSLDREGREKALETIGRFTSSRKQALEMYQSWLRDQVRAGKMSQRSANTRLRAALQQSIPIAK